MNPWPFVFWVVFTAHSGFVRAAAAEVEWNDKRGSTRLPCLTRRICWLNGCIRMCMLQPHHIKLPTSDAVVIIRNVKNLSDYCLTRT